MTLLLLPPLEQTQQQLTMTAPEGVLGLEQRDVNHPGSRNQGPEEKTRPSEAPDLTQPGLCLEHHCECAGLCGESTASPWLDCRASNKAAWYARICLSARSLPGGQE